MQNVIAFQLLLLRTINVENNLWHKLCNITGGDW